MERRDRTSRKPLIFDRKFNDGEDIIGLLDLAKARRSGLEPRRVNVDFPAWMVESLDKEAARLGVTRQALVKLSLADKLDHLSAA